MIFSSNLDHRKINPLVYVKFWRQACLPSLLYGAEVFTLTLTLLTKLERCQSWFLKIIFYVHKFPNFHCYKDYQVLIPLNQKLPQKALISWPIDHRA